MDRPSAPATDAAAVTAELRRLRCENVPEAGPFDSSGALASCFAPTECLLLKLFTDETLLHVACFLSTARDLLSLQLTSKRFATECIALSGGAGAGPPAAAPEMLSIAQEAARWWVAGCSEQERGWVPRCGLGSWLGRMHEVEALRVPLAFGRAHAEVTLSENGALATSCADDDFRTAASGVVMRSGRHFVQFTVVEGDWMYLGVVRPGWDVEGDGEEAQDGDGHCFYSTTSGMRFPDHSDSGGGYDWEGRQSAKEPGDRIGILLDLDQGSMTLYRNDDEKMGVMVAEGLTGPLCWAAATAYDRTSARIESAVAPASPTNEELAAVVAWQRRSYLDLPQAN